MKTALSPYNTESVSLTVQTEELAEGEEPYLPYGPELVHGLGNLIQNATQFAANSVALRLYWDLDAVRLTVQDDGPGFAPSVLSAIGEPYISTRAGDGENLGLGIFIAQTLLQKTGANLTFTNEDGAKVVISWPRAILEETHLKGEDH